MAKGADSRNILMNIRDVVAALAIMTIIPILASQIAALVSPEGLLEQHRKTEMKLIELDPKDNKQEYKELEKEHKQLQRQIMFYEFGTAIAIGITALLVGVFFPLFQAGIGLMLGGIATLSYNYFIYWNVLTNAVATISLIIALAGLICGMWYYRPQKS